MVKESRPVDQDRALAGLARQVDGLDRRLSEAEENLTNAQRAVRGVAESVATLAGRRSEATTGPADVPPAPEWLTLTDGAHFAGELLDDLGWWVTNVWSLYGTTMHPCWPYHPSVVAELLANRQVWLAATAEAARATALADWHERYRKGCADRLKAYMNPCQGAAVGGHQAPTGGRWTVRQPTDFAAIGEWWGAGPDSRRASQPPGLTPA